jgi:arylsulfatase A-like enzyme
MPRLRSLFCCVLCAVPAVAQRPDSRAPAPRPNVLLIVADDMGYSDAGCYGGEIRTPHLDAIAAGGLRFTQFYNTARCWPSRAALLTGHYAQSVRRDAVPGIRSGTGGTRPPWAPLLPSLLRELGYRSYHSGKWHVDGEPMQNGFDHSYSLNDHDRYFAPQAHRADGKGLPPVAPDSDYYATTAIADHTIAHLREHAEQHADRPWFAFVAFTAPHFPLQAPPADIAGYQHTYLPGWDRLRLDRWQRMQALGVGGKVLAPIERDVGPPYVFAEAMAKLGPAELNRPVPWLTLDARQREFQAAKMAVHAAMVTRMDTEIGRLLQQIDAMQATAHTLVVFLSDNGASAEIMVRGDGHDPHAQCGTGASFVSLGPGWSSLANTPFRRHKSWVHEGGIATPCIVRWPDGIAARGQNRGTPAHVVDLAPTILQLAGGEMPKRFADQDVPPAPGRSLLPAFAGDVTIERPSLWWQHEGNRALRVGDHKIVAAGKDAAWELYDLDGDRSETHDLAAEQPERVRTMASQWQLECDAYQAQAKRPDGDRQMK